MAECIQIKNRIIRLSEIELCKFDVDNYKHNTITVFLKSGKVDTIVFFTEEEYNRTVVRLTNNLC